MATPFSLQGSFTYPPDDGQPVATRAFSQSGNFSHRSESDYSLTGVGTQVVSLGSLPAVKAALIEVAPTSLAPVIVTFNGGTDPVEIAPGGFLAYSNPTPSAGITALSIDYTNTTRVQVYLLG